MQQHRDEGIARRVAQGIAPSSASVKRRTVAEARSRFAQSEGSLAGQDPPYKVADRCVRRVLTYKVADSCVRRVLTRQLTCHACHTSWPTPSSDICSTGGEWNPRRRPRTGGAYRRRTRGTAGKPGGSRPALQGRGPLRKAGLVRQHTRYACHTSNRTGRPWPMPGIDRRYTANDLRCARSD